MTVTTLNAQVFAGAIVTAIVLIIMVIGGILNIRSAHGPRERRFVTAMTPVLWAMVLAFMTCIYVLEPPERYIALVAFFVVIPFFMYRCTLRRLLIRELEARSAQPAGSDS